MHATSISHLLGVLAITLLTARVLGGLVRALGQPAVLGELLAGVILGTSVLGLVHPADETVRLLAEMGVVILLFEIGLETELQRLLDLGAAASAVAVVGVILPFALGYAVCRLLGMTNLVSIAAGATLTATSVGITARVLADLGRLQDPEGQIILGAAVLDDIIGLVVLTVVVGLSQGGGVHVLGLARTTGIAVGFLAITLLVGRLVVPSLFQLVSGVKLPGTVTTAAIILVFALAWLADLAGSAVILGAFVAGLLLARTPQAAEIEQGVTHLGHFFVPLFFVVVGAAVDVRVFNPLEKANRLPLLVGSLLIVAAVVGKFLAGYAPVWFRGSKAIIGVGMIPRGEVGLIFAQMGLSSGIFDRSLYSAVTITIMVTTFITPPLLKFLLSRRGNQKPPQPVCGHLSELVSDP